MDKWRIEPFNDEIIGWNIIKSDDPTDNDYLNSLAVVLCNEDLEESKSNAALISTAPELLDVCKRALTHLNKNLPLYDEIEYLINKAEGLEGDIESLSFFDDLENYPESVIEMDFKNNRCSYTSNATMNQLFLFQSFSDDVGLPMLNISGDFLVDDNFDMYDLRYPIGHIMSRNVFNDFVSYISDIYPTLKSFMTDFESQSEEVSLRDFVNDLFFKEFALKYKTCMSLDAYLDKYPLISDNDDIYMESKLPNFLENCPYAIHLDIIAKYNGQETQGVLLYNESKDTFYVYDQNDKSISFFMIPNSEEEKKKAMLEFIDLLDE